MTVNKEELLEILPHKGKMFLLSRVTDYDTKDFRIKAEYDVTSDGIFFEDKGVPNWACFEFMAQAISALTGIYDKMNNFPLEAGCLLSVSNFVSKRDFFHEGETLCIEADEEFRDKGTGIYRYNCSLTVKGESERCVEATITVMETDDLQSLLKL